MQAGLKQLDYREEAGAHPEQGSGARARSSRAEPRRHGDRAGNLTRRICCSMNIDIRPEASVSKGGRVRAARRETQPGKGVRFNCDASARVRITGSFGGAPRLLFTRSKAWAGVR